MSQALRKLTAIVSKTKTVVVFINQTRQKIGIVYGNPETTTGGVALKFYASLRVEVRRAAQIKQGERIIGNRVKAKVVKNKVAAPFRTCEFDIMYNEGISLAGDVLDVGQEYGVVKRAGNAYSYEGEKLGMGRENAKAALRERSSLMQEIRDKVVTAFRSREGLGDSEGTSNAATAPEDDELPPVE
jgi:recombination protein RecA